MPCPHEARNELVTIAITTFNRADGFLRDAIASALAQSHTNIEIIIADNCSSDHAKELIEGFRDARIDYVRHESNIGPFRNFNFCVERARGKYFCLLHDDDLMDPDFVASCLVRARDAGRCGVIQTGTRVIDSEGKIMHEVRNMGGGGGGEDFVSGWLENRFSPYLCSTMFDSECLREIGGFEVGNTLCDVRAEFHVAQRLGWLVVEDVKASFRQHDEKLTHAAAVRSWCRDSANLMREMLAAVRPGRRAELRASGKEMLLRMNFNRAAHVERPGQRLLANLIVMCQFRTFRPKSLNLGLMTKLRRALGSARLVELPLVVGISIHCI